MRWKILFVVSCIIGVFFACASTNDLPKRIAINFGADGWPNVWVGRAHYMYIFAGVYIVLLSLFLKLIPYTLRHQPLKAIHFPKKEYWLSPAMREKTVPVATNWFYALGIGLSIFYLLIIHFIVAAHYMRPVGLRNQGFVIASAAMLVFVAWLYFFYRRFNRTP